MENNEIDQSSFERGGDNDSLDVLFESSEDFAVLTETAAPAAVAARPSIRRQRSRRRSRASFQLQRNTNNRFTRTGGNDHLQESWYLDLLQQTNEVEDISNILGTGYGQNVAGSEADSAAGVDDEREAIAEQHKILAHLEASKRVKENTGFDLEDYERRRKEVNEPFNETGSKKKAIPLPEPRKIDGTASQNFEEPTLPPTFANRRIVMQKTPKVLELCPGVVVQGEARSGEAERLITCLGCKNKLQVHVLAMLVKCPVCATVSPAVSTTR